MANLKQLTIQSHNAGLHSLADALIIQSLLIAPGSSMTALVYEQQPNARNVALISTPGAELQTLNHSK
jgi:hypothetical protein